MQATTEEAADRFPQPQPQHLRTFCVFWADPLRSPAGPVLTSGGGALLSDTASGVEDAVSRTFRKFPRFDCLGQMPHRITGVPLRGLALSLARAS